MSSRDNILKAVKENQPPLEMKPVAYTGSALAGDVEAFQKVLETIGGTCYHVAADESVSDKIKTVFPDTKNVVSVMTSVQENFMQFAENLTGHSLGHIELAIMEAEFGVAENGAVWLTEANSKYRVLPFITEHLVVVIDAVDIVPDMHAAYEKIGTQDYDFGVFIAGPSKTADIEQSLVLGAHGPKRMTVIIKD
ncbi:LUD domain-containing protein [soil metagenome]